MALTTFESSALSDLQGAQQPRLSHVPSYVSSAGEEAIELAALAGLHLDEWQQLVLMHSLGERPDGKWAAYEIGLCVGRQNGKGSILEARELAGLFLLGEMEIVHSAHEQLTATNHFRRLLSLIRNVPDLNRRVLKAPQGKGAEAIELRNGQRILFKTRTSDAGRGLTGDLVVLDEAMNIPEAAMAALVPTMAARSIQGNPQLWYAGSAVDQETDPHGLAFARIRERGLAQRGRVAYFEWSADGEDPGRVSSEFRWDRDSWAQANPGLGIRISQEHIENECNGALGPRKFCVERLGIGDWPDTSEEAGRVISTEAWGACGEHDRDQRIVSAPVFAVDVNPAQTWGAIGVAGKRADDLVQTAVVAHEPDTGWIVERCLDLQEQYRRARFVVDKNGPAADLIPEMKDVRLDVIEASTQDYRNACGGFFNAVTNGKLRYPAPQPELDAALSGARKQRAADAWKWSRKEASSPDLSPLVACTLAAWYAATVKARSPRIINLNDFLEDASEVKSEM